SMPVRLWNDDDGELYRQTYFADFRGVWRQGDFFRVNERGGCFVLGRSDATLNRYGIRIGTAEIYAALESVPEVADALIVNLDLPDGGFFMPLFVRRGMGGRIAGGGKPGPWAGHAPRTVAAVGAPPAARAVRDVAGPGRQPLVGAGPGSPGRRRACQGGAGPCTRTGAGRRSCR